MQSKRHASANFLRLVDNGQEPQVRQPKRPKKGDARKAGDAKKEVHRIWEDIARLRRALANLALIERDPKTIIGEVASCDRSEIDSHLRASLEWLIQFSAEWHGHGQSLPCKTANLNSRCVLRLKEVWSKASNNS